ncbi:hypothetical protein [Aeromonas sp. 600724]|uniref:hypothetical protein n=1 Tax=Aeromonas sp. 600724 TaxID=2712031 RepID=UPI003BA1015C
MLNMDNTDETDKKELEQKTPAMELMKKYCPTAIMHAEQKDQLQESTFNFLIAELAENALSADVTGKPGLNLNLIRLEIEEILTQEDAVLRLKRAEMHFLESLESVKKLQGLRHREELEQTSDIIRSIKLGISRFNILFVILLIIGLTWAALNLPKDALALVAASIGGAITHLLSERNAVLAMKKENDKGGCHGCSDD